MTIKTTPEMNEKIVELLRLHAVEVAMDQWELKNYAAARIEELEAEVAIDDKLLSEHSRLLEAIPPCPLHGSQCVPHAIDWVERRLDTLKMREAHHAT